MPTALSAHRGAVLVMTLVAAVTVAAVPLHLVARTSYDEGYRACMADAGGRREESTVEAYREYHRRVEESMERKRDAVREAWTIEDDTERGNRLREIDREASGAAGTARTDLYARLREIGTAHWDAQRACESAQRDRQREERERQREEDRRRREEERSSSSRPGIPPPVGDDKCLSSNECGEGEFCTTERGDCESACEPGAEVCTMVCAGHCEPREEEPLSCDERKSEVQRLADENAACSVDADCRMVEQSCPFVTCGVAVNAQGEGAVRDAATAAAQCMTDSGQPIPCAGCLQRTPVCDAGRCVLR